MKITITKEELIKLINASINSDKIGTMVTDFEIRQSAYEKAIRQTIQEFPRHYSDQKISAIERLRELMTDEVAGGVYARGLELAEAKIAIENPQTAIQFWNTHQKPYHH